MASTTPMMACGHAANARNGRGEPACAICIGIHSGAAVVADAPDFSGRTAKCCYAKRRNGTPCTSESPSSLDLAFFEHTPDKPHDRFYCGCWGWD